MEDNNIFKCWSYRLFMVAGIGGGGNRKIPTWEKIVYVGAFIVVAGFAAHQVSLKDQIEKIAQHRDRHKRELTDYFSGPDSALSKAEEFKMNDFIGVGDSASTYQITPREYLGAYWKMLNEEDEVTEGKHYLVLRKEAEDFYKNLEHLKFVRSKKDLNNK